MLSECCSLGIETQDDSSDVTNVIGDHEKQPEVQQSGLARVRGQGTGQAGAVDDFPLFGRSMGLSQAAVELQVSLLLLL